MNTSQPVPWHKVGITWLIFGIPLVAVVLGVVLIFLSIKHFDGLVVDDYYKQGLGINQTLKRQQRATSLQLKANLRLNMAAGKVDVLIDGNDSYLPPEFITLGLYHSTRSDNDHVVELHSLSTKQYTGVLPQLAPGRWNILLETPDWRLHHTLVWPAQTTSISLNAEPAGQSE